MDGKFHPVSDSERGATLKKIFPDYPASTDISKMVMVNRGSTNPLGGGFGEIFLLLHLQLPVHDM